MGGLSSAFTEFCHPLMARPLQPAIKIPGSPLPYYEYSYHAKYYPTVDLE